MSRFSLLVLLAACEPGGDKDTADGLGDADDVTELCAESTPKSVVLEVGFDAYAGECPWGEGDNLEAQDATFTARVEETESLAMPADSVICDVGYDFQIDPEQSQIMQYDDHFVFTFVDVVLASSGRQIVDFLPVADDGLVPWDWSAVAGQPLDFNDTEHWCMGEDEGLASCEIPEAETPGALELDFDPSIVAKLSYRAVELNRADFTFITLGDNDPGKDCSHNAFEFTVNVDYVEQ